MPIRVLSAADVRRALSARDAVDAMRAAFGELSGGTATVPVRSHLESARGLMLVMPAVLGMRAALGAKVVSVFPDNPSRGLPAVQGAVLLLDAETGRARALLDGTSLTAVRTAAASALATDLLARADADVLAVFGAGAQGRSHVELLARTRRLREVRVVSRSGASAERLAAQLSEADSLVPDDASGPRSGPRDSGPRGRARRRRPGGDRDEQRDARVRGGRPGARRARERRRRLPPRHAGDRRRPRPARPGGGGPARGGVGEAGDLIVPAESGLIGRDAVDAEIGEIVNGDAPPGRGGRDFTLFESVGNAARTSPSRRPRSRAPNARTWESWRPSDRGLDSMTDQTRSCCAETAVPSAERGNLGVLAPF